MNNTCIYPSTFYNRQGVVDIDATVIEKLTRTKCWTIFMNNRERTSQNCVISSDYQTIRHILWCGPPPAATGTYTPPSAPCQIHRWVSLSSLLRRRGSVPRIHSFLPALRHGHAQPKVRPFLLGLKGETVSGKPLGSWKSVFFPPELSEQRLTLTWAEASYKGVLC